LIIASYPNFVGRIGNLAMLFISEIQPDVINGSVIACQVKCARKRIDASGSCKAIDI
jgi:hypothetical protein